MTGYWIIIDIFVITYMLREILNDLGLGPE